MKEDKELKKKTELNFNKVYKNNQSLMNKDGIIRLNVNDNNIASKKASFNSST